MWDWDLTQTKMSHEQEGSRFWSMCMVYNFEQLLSDWSPLKVEIYKDVL